MASDEIVCVHVLIKFLIFKNIEKDENCLCDNFIIYVGDVDDIESDDVSKGYFIKKFHKILKKKRRNEYECVLNGTITEIANFLYQHIELFIKIKKIAYDLEDNNDSNKERGNRRRVNICPSSANGRIREKEKKKEINGNADTDMETDEEISAEIDMETKSAVPNETRSRFRKVNKNVIHLLRSLDMQDDFNFENSNIYFKCLFKDLINDIEFFENKTYENISNFYITNDLIFSIGVKFEECFINKKDLYISRMCLSKNRNEYQYKHRNYDLVEKYDHRYKHILSIFPLKSVFYFYIDFQDYTQEFFQDNIIEIMVGGMVQHLSANTIPLIDNVEEKDNLCLRQNRSGNTTIGRMAQGEDIIKNTTNGLSIGCHFSLILIENVKELYDYFCINDIFINFNKTKIEVQKKGILSSPDSNDMWMHYPNYNKITYTLNTFSSGVPNLKFEATIISFLLNEGGKHDSNSDLHSDRRNCNDNCLLSSRDCSNYPHHCNGVSDDSCYTGDSSSKNHLVDSNFNILTNKDVLLNEKRKPNVCNIFFSVHSCHILELSNIYAEKRNKQSDFFIKMDSSLFHQQFVSPTYPFQENKQIELRDCHVSLDTELEEDDKFKNLEKIIIHFEICLREKESNISIGTGELPMKSVISELKEIRKEGNIQNYYKRSYNVPLYLNVFKEKYLTSEINMEIFFSLKKKKILKEENNILVVGKVKNPIDSNKIP
ncbi:Cg7 protein, putative, partial [Plasmodium ovale curtisi]